MASRKYNYFEALIQLTAFSCQAAEYLDSVICNFNPDLLQKNIEEMHHIENAADEKRHEIMLNLAKEFLPPIELGDIVDLASKLDDITDCVDDIVQQLFIYNVETLLPECKDFSKLIISCCESVRDIAKEFSHFRKSTTIMQSIVHTNSIESEADKLYLDTMHKLLISGMPDIKIFTWSRIITLYEDCCDNCEQAAELFESVIMKNS